MDYRFQNRFAELLAEIDIWVDDAVKGVKNQTGSGGKFITKSSLDWLSILVRIRNISNHLTTDWHKAFSINFKKTGAWFFVRDYSVVKGGNLTGLTAFWAEEAIVQPNHVRKIISGNTPLSCWDGYFDSLMIQSVEDAARRPCPVCGIKVPVVGYRELSKDHMDPSDFFTALHTFCLKCKQVIPLADRYTQHRD